MVLRYTFRVFRLFFSTYLQEIARKNWKQSISSHAFSYYAVISKLQLQITQFLSITFTKRFLSCQGSETSSSGYRTSLSIHSPRCPCFYIYGLPLVIFSGLHPAQSLVLLPAPTGIHCAHSYDAKEVLCHYRSLSSLCEFICEFALVLMFFQFHSHFSFGFPEVSLGHWQGIL